MDCKPKSSSSAEKKTTLQKRPYQAPVLVEWGAITEITQGPMGGIEDFPLGGTMGV